jgi:hypothetical protein
MIVGAMAAFQFVGIGLSGLTVIINMRSTTEDTPAVAAANAGKDILTDTYSLILLMSTSWPRTTKRSEALTV